MNSQLAIAKRAANNRKINAALERPLLLAFVNRSLALGLSALLTLQPVIANAQSVSPSSTSAAANRPDVGAAPNGIPLIDIVTPSGQGLSHNKYDNFNVGTPGLILNNYNAEVGTSRLGGATPGNPNLRNSGPANVILNEMTTTNRTQLDGPMEVFGGRADVIVANPNGITCDGCGFINTPHATLTSGTPDIGGDGRLEGFTVRGGDVTFGQRGGNFAADPGAVDLVDVVSRSISVNGPVFSRDLRLTAGRNKFNYATGEAAALEATSGTPEFAIDGSALGAMQADRIKMVVTEKGAGVRMSGNMAANTNELSLSSDGKISIGNASGQQGVSIRSSAAVSAARVTSKRNVAVQATSGISLQSVAADGDIVFAAGAGLLTVAGEVTSLGNVKLSSGGDMLVGSVDSVQAASLASTSGSVQVTGTARSAGSLAISAVAGGISAASLVSSDNIGLTAGLGIGVANDILAAGNVAASGQSISSGSLASGVDFDASERAGGNIVLTRAGNMTLTASGRIVSGALLSAGATDIAAATLTARSVTSHGKIDINATTDIGGLVLGAGDVNISGQGIRAASIASGVDFSASAKAGSNIVLSKDGNMTLTASGRSIEATEIFAAGDLNATAATIKATDITGRKLVALNGSTTVDNQILGARDVHISGQTIAAGSIVSGVDIDATNAANGTIILSNSGSLTLDAAGGNIAVKALLSAGDLTAKAATLAADSVTSHGDIGIDSSVDISGQLIGAANVALTGSNISAGLLASGVDFDASNASDGSIVLAKSGDLAVDATGGSVTAGALLSAGKVELTSKELTAQTVTGHGNVAIAADTNVSGQIVGGSNVGITGPDIRAGVIVSGVDFAKTGHSPSGDFVLGEAGDLALTATSASINAGNLQAAGNLVANAKQDIAANAVAHQAMSMTALGAINLSGQSISAGNIDLKASSISVDTLVSGMDFAASAASPTGSLMLDRSGAMTLAASGGSITAGNLLSGGDLSAIAAQNIDYQSLQGTSAASLNAVGGSISIDKETRVTGNITLATQSLDFSNNRAKIATGQTLTVKAGTATFAGSNMTFGGLDLNLSGTANLTDAKLNAVTSSGGTGNIAIGAAGLTTTGATAILAANDLTLTLPELTNSGQLAAGHDLGFNIADDLTNKQTGLIYAGNDATLLVGSNLLNDQGAIIAGHNLTIAGATPDQKNRAITNVSGAIQSGGDMVILTENLTNKRVTPPMVTRNVLVSSGVVAPFSINPYLLDKPYAYLIEDPKSGARELYKGVSPPAWSDYLPYLFAVASTSDSTTYHAWNWDVTVGQRFANAIIDHAQREAAKDSNGDPVIDPNRPVLNLTRHLNSGSEIDTSFYYYWRNGSNITQSIYEDQFAAPPTPEAKIHADGDLFVHASTFNNSYSSIEAAGDATLEGSALNNEGVALARTTTTSCNADGPCQAFDAAGNRNPSKDIANGTSIVSGTEVIGSVAGSIKAGKVLDTDGYTTVNNTAGAGSMASSATLATPDASSNPLTALNGLTAGAALFDISASLARLSPDAATASVSGNILIGKLTVALGGASLADYVRINGQAMAALAKPQSGGVGGTIPGQTFLFETRAAYLDVGKFYGSGYFINRIGYRPDNTIPFLGDAYFENQLIDEQMRQLSGEGLGPNSFVPGSDAIARMKTLLDNGIAYAQAHNLPLGGALSPQQAAEITQSMVIYQTQTIGGAEVIAPVFYMAAADSRKVKVAGAMLSGETVSMKVGTLNNSGAVAASGNLHIVAASIKADGGSFDAGGDLKIDSAGQLTLTTQSLNIGGQTMVNPNGGVHAGGNLGLSANDDLTLSGVKVTAGKDASLSGKNVTLGAAKTTNGGQQNATGAEFSAGGNALIVANDNVNIIGSSAKAGGSLGIGATNGSVNVVTTDLARKTESGNGKTASTEQLKSALSSGGSTTITAGDGILISGSSVKSGGDVALKAENDINITPLQSRASTSFAKDRATSSSSEVTHQGSEITSGGSVFADAGHDLNVIGSKITAAASVNLHAANNVTIGDVTDTETSDYHDKKKGGFFGGGREQTTHTETDTVVGSSISGKTGVTITSGKNTTVSASKITAGDAGHKADLNIVTGGDLLIASGKDVTAVDDKSKKSSFLSKKTTTHNGTDETTVGSDLSASGNVNLDAGKAAVISGSNVKAGGSLYISGDSVAVIGAEEDHSSSDSKTKSGLFAGSGGGFFSLRGKSQNDKTGTSTRNVGSSLSSGAGQDITIVARKTDVDIIGSAISAGRDFVVDAARDVNVLPGAEISDATSLDKRSGFGLQLSSGNGSASIGIGVGKATNKTARDQSTNAPSSLSAGHDILVTAGRDANLQAANLSAGNDARVIADRDVNLLSAQDQSNYRELHEQFFTGVSVTVESNLISAGQSVQSAASGLADKNGIYSVAPAALAAYNSHQTIDQIVKDHAVNGSISLTAGFTSSKSQQASSSSTPVVTTIRAGRSVTLVAKSGNLTGRGAQILAGLDANDVPIASDDPETGNVHLWAGKAVDLESAEATSNSSSDSKSASAAIGISAGFSIGAPTKNQNSAGVGFTASASGSKGKSTGSSVTEVNSHVIGTGTVFLHSGGDTTLKGAVISGRSVIEDVGGNLFIESLQDLQRYDAKTVSGSLSLKSGAAPSGGVNIAKLNGNYANVTEQSGIFAGDGGYHVKVGGNVDLKGGAIASTASPDNNDLTARSLTFSNIENTSKASASSYGIVLGPGGIPLPVVGQPAKQNDHGETLATLSLGHLTLSDQTQDLASLNTDLSKANDQAKPFDIDKLQKQQQSAAALSQLLNMAIGTIAQKLGFDEGSPEKVALHAAAGAITALVSGGNIGSGALAGGAEERKRAGGPT